jgi:hypothetical protein
MAVRLALTLGSEEDAGLARVFDLADDFESVVNGVIPPTAPSSALEARDNSTHRKADGGRLLVPPHHVAWVEEIPD